MPIEGRARSFLAEPWAGASAWGYRCGARAWWAWRPTASSGGLGTSWANDPHEDLVGVVLTTDMFASAFPPPAVIQDFWTCVYAALDGPTPSPPPHPRERT